MVRNAFVRQSLTPNYTHVITTYNELEVLAGQFAQGKFNLILLIGPPGVGKSRTFHDAVAKTGKPVCMIENHATAFGFYSELYEHQDELVIIDDLNALYTDSPSVNLLKCLCQTEDVKTMRWLTATTRKGDIPPSFETNSRVALIANDWATKNEAVRALQDRAICLHFCPTPTEIHEQVAKWFDDQEVFDWMADRLPLMKSPSIRHYTKASELRRSGLPNWMKIADDQLDLCKKTACVIRLESEKLTTEERTQKFAAEGHGARATYFRFKNRIANQTKLMPKIKLPNART